MAKMLVTPVNAGGGNGKYRRLRGGDGKMAYLQIFPLLSCTPFFIKMPTATPGAA